MARVKTAEEGSTLAQKRWGKRAENEAVARTRRITALADKAELEAAKMSLEMVARQPVLALVQELAQRERDSILAWPARAASLLAAELGVDEHTLHAALDASLREHLTARAEIPLEI